MKELPSALTKASLLSSAMRLKLSRASLIAFLAIYPLRAITPASIILLIACILRLRSGVAAFFRESRIRSIVFVYSLLESSFFLWFLYARKRAQKRQELDINETKEQRWELFTRIANAGLPGCRYQFVREWFYPTSLENVGREDMKRWLSWAFFDKPLEEVLADNYSEELDDMITSLENGIGFKFPDGSTDTPLILLNLDPVVAKHRPLLHYAVTSCLDLGMNVNLQIKRFRRYSYEKAKYWIRDMGKKELKPLVFIHGVGIGLATYLPFLNEINTERTIILIELAHVSMKLRLRLRHIPSMKQTVETIEGILLKHGYESALWMGHSLGTFIVACALQYRPEIVNNVILVDPVCLMLWEPRLVKNFVYRKPITPRQRIQNYHVSKELHISYYFQRHFCWRQCTLFADQLPSDSTVFLSEYDDICNHDRTLFYLQKHNIVTISFSKHAHGGWILKPESRSKIVKAIDYYQ